MARLSLSLLGPLEVRLDGRPITALAYDKVWALLAYLAVEADRPHRRDALVGLLWPEQPDHAARTNLRQALTQLRQALGDHTAQPPFLLIAREIIQFNRASNYDLDVMGFTTLLAACDAHPHRHPETCTTCARRRAEAAELYRSGFLEEFFLADAAPFEEWALVNFEELRDRVLSSLVYLADYHERRGAYEDVRRYARQQLELDPWHDAAHRRLMRVLVLLGQRSAALSQYERCRRVLAEELSLAPEAETTALYEHIKHGHVLLTQRLERPPTNLYEHTLPNTFIGREAELAQLAERLERRDCRLLTLSGPGGIGKTRLAQQVAAELCDSFTDGVWFVPLAAIHDPALVVTTIARTLGITEAPGQPLIIHLKRYLGAKELLLVLDNFEQVVDAGPLIAELLASARQLTVIITSRSVLHLSGEQEFPVSSMALPDRRHLPAPDQLTEYEAVRLFIERAQVVKSGFAMTYQNAPAVAEICYRLDGLPLAIELAAARIKLFSPEGLLARLSSPLTLLTGGAQDLPARQQTLRATINWSYHLLDEDEQLLFARLGIFVGGCSLEAAEAICNPDGASPIDVVDGVASLLDRSLLRQDEGMDGEPRFTMLETIREYALERLAASGDAVGLRQQHAAYYLALVERAEPQLRGPQQKLWLDRLEAEHDNLRAVLRRCSECGEMTQVARLSGALWWFWYLRGHWSEGQRWLEAALAHGHRLPTPLRAKVLLGIGWLVAFQGDFAKARTLLEESLDLCRDLRNTAGIADSLNGLGWVAFGQSDFVGARVLLEENLALCREHDYIQGSARALYLLGFIARLQGEDAVARAMYQESLRLYRELRDKGGIAASLWGLGYVAVNQGDAVLAAPLLEESLALYQECGEKLGISSALNGLGHVAEVQGDYQRAATLFERSLALRREMGDRRGGSVMLNNLGRVVLARGDIARATLLFEESLIVCRDLEYKVGGVTVLASLATVAGRVGQPERAARLWGAAEAIRKAINTTRSPVDQVCDECDIATARAQLDDASFAAAWADGRAMTLKQAIDYALDDVG